MSPSKGDRPPPPLPPQRKHDHGPDKSGEPDIKHRKTENADNDLPPPKPPRTTSLEKSPDKSKSDLSRTVNAPDSFGIDKNSNLSSQERVDSLDSAINETKNNNARREDTGVSSGGIGNHAGHHGNQAPPLQGEGGPTQGGEQNQSGAVMGNSTGATEG